MRAVLIDDREYNLHFGFDFIRELDKRYEVTENGVSFGFGVQHAVIDLQQQNPLVLLDLIQAGTATEPQKPSVIGIERYVSREAESGRLDELFDDFLSALRMQPLTKGIAVKIIGQVEDAQALN